MKKLKLNLGGNMKEMLSREQMKKVIGGDYGGCINTCSSSCPCSSSSDWCVNGLCQKRP